MNGSTQSRVTISDVEVKLRGGAGAARVTPSPQLRRQTIARLHDTPHHRDQPSVAMRLRATLTAATALASIMILIALIATLVRPHGSQTPVVVAPNIAPIPSIAHVAAPLGEELQRPIPNPLAREARLIVQDARSTLLLLQHQLPLRPRFEPTHAMPTPSVTPDPGNGV